MFLLLFLLYFPNAKQMKEKNEKKTTPKQQTRQKEQIDGGER